MLSKIVPVPVDRLNASFASPNQTFYELSQSEVDFKLNGLVFRLTFVTQAFLTKFIPCILLIILSSLLIHSIHQANKSSKRLQSLGRKTKESEKSREHTRTNIMLVMVCVIFFLTEFPQGIIAILSIILESTNFHTEVYMKLGDFMDMLSLINNAINFILYCLMSRTFRRTFKDILFRMLCLFRKPSPKRKNAMINITDNANNFNLKPNYQANSTNIYKASTNNFKMLNQSYSSSLMFYKIKDAINKDSSNCALYSSFDFKTNLYKN
jgi:hypothetical protein